VNYKKILKVLFFIITIILALFGIIQILNANFINFFSYNIINKILIYPENITYKPILILQIFWFLLYIINFLLEESYNDFFWPLLLFPIIFFRYIT
jgi:hypothetical protein